MKIMKRTILKWMPMLCLGLLCAGFASCGDDDDNGVAVSEEQAVANLDAPAYESVSAKYNITDEDADLKSIELTASGEYIVTTKTTTSGVKQEFMGTPNNKARIFSAMMATTRGYSYYYYNYVHGKFQKVSDTEFILEGWGRLVVEDGATSIKITYENGSVYSFPVEKVDASESRQKTNDLCRSWNLNKFRMRLKYIEDGRTYINYDKTFTTFNAMMSDVAKELEKTFGDEMDVDDMIGFEIKEPKEVVFTKAGTYMVKYEGDELAVSTWKWEDYDNNIIRYSWNYDSMYDDYLGGTATVKFSGKQLVITEGRSESETDEDGSFSFESLIIYYCDEVK